MHIKQLQHWLNRSRCECIFRNDLNVVSEGNQTIKQRKQFVVKVQNVEKSNVDFQFSIPQKTTNCTTHLRGVTICTSEEKLGKKKEPMPLKAKSKLNGHSSVTELFGLKTIALWLHLTESCLA